MSGGGLLARRSSPKEGEFRHPPWLSLCVSRATSDLVCGPKLRICLPSSNAAAARHWRSRMTTRGSQTKPRSEEHTSELQSLMRISYAVFCLKKKKKQQITTNTRKISDKTQIHKQEQQEKTKYTIETNKRKHRATHISRHKMY